MLRPESNHFPDQELPRAAAPAAPPPWTEIPSPVNRLQRGFQNLSDYFVSILHPCSSGPEWRYHGQTGNASLPYQDPSAGSVRYVPAPAARRPAAPAPGRWPVAAPLCSRPPASERSEWVPKYRLL